MRSSTDAGRAVTLRLPVLYGVCETNVESAVNTLISTVLKADALTKPIDVDDWAIRYPFVLLVQKGRYCPK